MKYITMFLMNIFIFVIVIKEGELFNVSNQCQNVREPLSSIRKRRHLTFPDGSNIVLTISLVKAFMTHAPSGWNIALEIDVLFPLPDSKFTNAHFRRKLHHRQKREFWERITGALKFHNLDGHACLIKSICEARSNLAPPGKSLVHDILRAIFGTPLHENDFVEEIKPSYNEVTDPKLCEQRNDCPFSILSFVNAFNKQMPL